MPSKSWNGSSASSKLTIAYDGISTSGDEAWITNPRITFYSSSSWSDGTNSIKAEGGAVVDKTWTNTSFSGGTKTFTPSAQRQTISYGSTTSANFTAKVTGISFFNGDGSTDSYSLSVTYPARAYSLPKPPPTATATKVSDTQFTIAWTTDYTSSSGATPWTGVYVERWDNVTKVWTRKATLARTVTSWSDTTTVADRTYQWRVQSYNSTGKSGYTSTTQMVTTPASHSSVVATKSDLDIILTWDQNSAMAVSTTIEESQNGGTTWAALASVGAGLHTYTHVAPSAGATHMYRVRPLMGSVSGAWVNSNNVQLLTNPAAPTNLTPTGSVYLDRALAITTAWKHNALDGSAQTAYEVQWRTSTDGGATWTMWSSTNKVASATQSRTWAANTFAIGTLVEWQVRTWGQYAVEPSSSPWSAAARFNVTAAPTATITSPTNGASLGSSTTSVTLTYSGSAAMASKTIKVYDGTGTSLLATETFTGTGTTVALAYAFENNTAYQLRLQAVDTRGLSSAVSTVNITTDFVPPPPPLVSATPDVDVGSVVISIENPAPVLPQVAAISNMLFRSIDGGASWELLHDNLPVNAAYTDYTAPTAGETLYRAVAASATPTYAESAEVSLIQDPAGCSEYIWLSAGPDFSVVGRFRGSPAVDTEHEREKALRQFFNRTDPVQFVGQYVKHVLSFSGLIEETDPLSTEQRFTDIHDWDGLVLYRDAWGRRVFGSLGAVSFTQRPYNLQEFSTTLTRADHHAD